MSKFKVGEKVVLYHTNKIICYVYKVLPGIGYRVGNAGFETTAHEKQLRKLVKKKKEYYWIYKDRKGNLHVRNYENNLIPISQLLGFKVKRIKS